MTEPVLEIVEFRTTANEEMLLDSAAAMEPWLAAQPGFRARRLAALGDGAFIDCIEWDDLHAAKRAAANIMSAAAAKAFLACIDSASVVMRHAPIVLRQ